MAVIALIDDSLCFDALPRGRIRQKLCIQNGSISTQPLPASDGDSRASVCTQILERLTSDYSLIPIWILKAPAAPLDVSDLTCALNACLRLGADIVGIGLGTACLSDGARLQPHLRRLTQAGVRIVAPLHASGHVTVPASLGEVFGVQSDHSQRLDPGEFVWDPHHPLGAQILANHEFPWLIEKQAMYERNSLAVPVFVAAINNWLNAGLDVAAQLRKRRREALFLEQTCAGHARPRIYLEQAHFAPGFCLSLLDELALKQQTQAVLLTEQPVGADVRCFSVAELCMGWAQALRFLERHTASDLILIAGGSPAPKELPPVDARLSRGDGCLLFSPRDGAPFSVPYAPPHTAAGVMRWLEAIQASGDRTATIRT